MRNLCHQAEEASRDNDLMLDNCGKALGNAGEGTQAETLAVRRDRLLPEDTRNQKMCLPLIRSIIERCDTSVSFYSLTEGYFGLDGIPW